jgi:hypothetical protein
MGAASSPGLMGAPIRDLLSRTTLKERASTNGQMAASTKVSGETTRWKDKVFLPGQTDADTKENTLMTRRKELAPSSGPMGASMKEHGKTGSNTVSGSTLRPLERPSVESGMKASVLPGLTDIFYNLYTQKFVGGKVLIFTSSFSTFSPPDRTLS